MTGLYPHELDFVLEQYGDTISPFQMCPLPLFAEIIKINHLRMRAMEHASTEARDISQEGYKILSRIHGFSPEELAQSKPASKEDWILLGSIYQAAVALYCISSLQSLAAFPATSSLRARCAAHGLVLQELLNEALSSPRIKRFMLWPLVVLGVEAVHSDASMRAFVEKQLPEMSRHIGTYVPLMAKSVLESFWASGETHWDACFDRPYAFVTQIAVDVSNILLRH